jgi:hypothetical protein
MELFEKIQPEFRFGTGKLRAGRKLEETSKEGGAVLSNVIRTSVG